METKLFYIVIEKVPGDRRSEEYFWKECEDETQAWDYAREKSRGYGAMARVKSVEDKTDRSCHFAWSDEDVEHH